MLNRDLLVGAIIGLALFYAWCYFAGQGAVPWPVIPLRYDKAGQPIYFRNQIGARADNPSR
jgi:hypothetical protein